MTIASTTGKKAKRRAKIAIIGGGNPSCAALIQGFVQQASFFQGCHITLMDSKKEKLDLIYTLGSKLIQHAAVDVTLERTTNQKAALSDANFVLTLFRIGGMQARHLDEKLPLQHGLIGAETIGVGGFFSALRTIPVIAAIAAEMEKIAPRAFLLNCTTPVNTVTEAVTHCSGIHAIGIDAAAEHDIQQLAQEVGVDAEPGKRLSQRTIGLNQSNWTTAVWRDGIDVLPQIIEWSKTYAEQELTPTNYPSVMRAILTAEYHALPASAMPYYYFPERVLAFQHQQTTTPAEDMLATLPDMLAHYREEAQKDTPHVTTMHGTSGFSDVALHILRCILNNAGEEWILNVPNRGAINFLADDRVVEVPCYVDARGATPIAQGDGAIALDQRGLLSLLAEYEGATAKAALWGSRKDAIRALAANPLILSYSKAEEVYTTLATAHSQYLPERLL